MIAQTSAIVKKIVIKIVLFGIDKLQLVCYNVKASSGCRAVVSRQKQLSVVFGVANVQKQGVMGVRPALRAVRLCFKRKRA